jgi:hypothetical protein
MQTFLPLANFYESAACLDVKRLGKQRCECKQIMLALEGAYNNSGAWINHPAVMMWRNYESALASYGAAVCKTWRNLGYKDSLLEFFQDRQARYLLEHSTNGDYWRLRFPPWMGDENFHASHRSNLLRKNREWYSKFGWSESDDLPYVWPV